MSRNTSLIICLLLLCLQGCGKGSDLKQILSDSVAGWQATEQAVFYDGKRGIFEYMNGGAEVYLAYDFNGLAARKYIRAGFPLLQVEVYDMGSPPEAYGIFSFERSVSEAGVGQGSEYDYGMLRFWQGKYFYNIYAEEEVPGLQEAMIELGNALVSARNDCGRGPDLVNILPLAGLDERSVRYFHGVFGLKQHYFLSQEDILLIGEDNEVVLATYQRGKSKLQLVLVRYASELAAKNGEEKFLAAMLELAKEKGKIATGRKGARLAVVFGGVDKQTTRTLIEEILL